MESVPSYNTNNNSSSSTKNEQAKNEQAKNEATTPLPIQIILPYYHVIGSMYVDLYCFLNSIELPSVQGSDTHLSKPIEILPGGSSTNTATHLQSLLLVKKQQQKSIQQQLEQTTAAPQPNLTSDHTNNDIDNDYNNSQIILHGALNETDEYGQILLKHVNKYSIRFQNHYSHQNQNHFESTTTVTTTATPHCVVLVTNTDRSFLSYNGCNDYFNPAKSIDWNISSLTQTTTTKNNQNHSNNYNFHNNNTNSWDHHHPIHIHLAGFYCTPGFLNNKELIECLQNLRLQQQEQRDEPFSSSSTNSTKETTTTITQPTIIISMVAQSDATNKYDGGIYAIIQCLDYLIMNIDEATNIYNNMNKNRKYKEQDKQQQQQHKNKQDNDAGAAININNSDGGSANRHSNNHHHCELFDEWIQFFSSWNTNVCYIITRGSLGAIAFRNYQILAVLDLPSSIINQINVIDPTGAGDAFAAGFLYGLWNTPSTATGTYNIQDDENNNDQTIAMIQNGLRWGCAAGTSCVQICGASIPSKYDDIQEIYNQLSFANNDSGHWEIRAFRKRKNILFNQTISS